MNVYYSNHLISQEKVRFIFRLSFFMDLGSGSGIWYDKKRPVPKSGSGIRIQDLDPGSGSGINILDPQH
jgi:hypothetical protein